MPKTKDEKYYVMPAGPEYDELEFEVEKSLAAREVMRALKKPTSVALDEVTIKQLKSIAEERGIPYQVLMRSYIIEGIRKDKKGAK